jgi:hypothetical protein
MRNECMNGHIAIIISLISIATILIKGVALFKTTDIERIFLSTEKRVIISIIEYSIFSSAISYLIIFLLELRI